MFKLIILYYRRAGRIWESWICGSGPTARRSVETLKSN